VADASDLLPSPSRQQALLRMLVAALEDFGTETFLSGPIEGLDGGFIGEIIKPDLTDPSTAWRRPPTEPFDLVFLLAAQVVVRTPDPSRSAYDRDWRVRCLEPDQRPPFEAALQTLTTPRHSLACQLGLRATPLPRRRRSVVTEDGTRHFIDFDDLLGVERKWLPRRGLLGRVLPGLGWRCSSRRCRTPLPHWSPRCHGCGRPVKGERPLRESATTPR